MAATYAPRRARLLLMLATIPAAACSEDLLTPADAYVLLTPAEGGTSGAAPLVRRLDLDDPAALALERQFSTGFAGEMVRTVHLAKQLVRSGTWAGQAFSAEARQAAGHALGLVVGAPGEAPYGRGLAFPRLLRGPLPRPQAVWLALPARPQDDQALVQTITGRLAAHVAHWVAGAGRFDPSAPPPPALVEGYRMAMEVIAREWRVGRGPEGALPTTAGTEAQRHVFASVRENRFVLTRGGEALRSPVELLAEPGVAAAVLYRLAQTKGVAQRVAPPATYTPFVSGTLPPGVTGAAMLGPFRNFQAKLLTAWARAVVTGRPPRDIVDLVEAYAALYPEERVEVLRIFLVTTFGGTAVPGGVSRRPEDASASLAALEALAADVNAGKRALRAP